MPLLGRSVLFLVRGGQAPGKLSCQLSNDRGNRKSGVRRNEAGWPRQVTLSQPWEANLAIELARNYIAHV